MHAGILVVQGRLDRTEWIKPTVAAELNPVAALVLVRPAAHVLD